MNLLPLTAVVGRAPSHNGDWTYHLATPGRWISMDSTTSTRSSYVYESAISDDPCDGLELEGWGHGQPTARIIIAAALVITVVIGLVLVLTVDTSHAVEVARSSWGVVASVARSSWG